MQITAVLATFLKAASVITTDMVITTPATALFASDPTGVLFLLV